MKNWTDSIDNENCSEAKTITLEIGHGWFRKECEVREGYEEEADSAQNTRVYAVWLGLCSTPSSGGGFLVWYYI